MKKIFIIFMFLIVSCGYNGAVRIQGTNEYQLPYCNDEEDCFKAADKTCPNGYRITKYGSIRPEKFICKDLE